MAINIELIISSSQDYIYIGDGSFLRDMCFEHFFPILHNILLCTLIMTLANASLGVLTWSSSLRLRCSFNEAMQGFAGRIQQTNLKFF
jgi:hypothetical protein